MGLILYSNLSNKITLDTTRLRCRCSLTMDAEKKELPWTGIAYSNSLNHTAVISVNMFASLASTTSSDPTSLPCAYT